MHEFSLYDASLRGLRRGVIDAELASTLATELHFGRYARFAEYPASIGVGASVWISDGTATLSSDCLGPDPPSG